MPPIPRAVVPLPKYDTPPGTVTLSSNSDVGSSPVYSWSLVAWPDGATPGIVGATTTTPQITGVSEPGTYLVFLSITDATGASHPVPYPVQSQVAPYGFTSPLASAFAAIRVAEASGLVKPARGQYGWLEDLWAAIDKIGEGGFTFPYYDETTNTLQANTIVPATGDNLGITADGNILIDAGDELHLAGPIIDGTLYADTISASTQSITISNSSGQSSVLIGTDISISSADDIALSTTASNGNIAISSENGDISVTGNEVHVRNSTLSSYIDINSGFSIFTTGTGAITATTGGLVVAPTLTVPEITSTSSLDISSSGTTILTGNVVNVTAESGNLTCHGQAVSLFNSTEVSSLVLGANKSGIYYSGSGADSSIEVDAGISLSADSIAATAGSGNIELSAPAGTVQISPAISVPTISSSADLTLSASDDVSITAADDITIAASGVTSIINIDSDLRINLTAGDVSAPLSGSINLSGDATINVETTVGDITLNSADDVTISSTDDVIMTSGDSTAITATGSLLQLWGKGGLTTSLPNPTATTSTLIRANKRIELTPDIDTYTAKPIRAPGITAIAVGTKIGTDPIPEGGEEKVLTGEDPSFTNYTNAARFTRHTVGSELRVELLVVGAAGSGASLPALGLVKHSATTAELIFKVEAPVQPFEPDFKFKASARIINLSANKIIIQHDCVGRADLGVGPAEQTSTDCIIVDYASSSDVTDPVWFEVMLYEAIDEYSVSMTSTLYNPHTQDVL